MELLDAQILAIKVWERLCKPCLKRTTCIVHQAYWPKDPNDARCEFRIVEGGMDHAVELLRNNVKIMFGNRHDVGWGYRNLGKRKEYRRCQHERIEELRSYIRAIRALRKVGSHEDRG